MPLSKQGIVTRPYAGGSRGGTSMRNVKRHGSFLSGMREVVWSSLIPTHNQVLGDGINLTSITAGSLIFDRDGGNPPKVWATAFPSVPCSVCIDTKTASANTEVTIRIAGYDQFDRLVEEEISVIATEKTALSSHAYSELIQAEVVSKGSSHVTDLDISVLGASNHSALSVNWTSTDINASCRIGLPFIPTDPGAVKAIHIHQNGAAGYVRRTSDNVWEMQNENGGVADSTALTDADMYGGDIGNACILLPANTQSNGHAMVTMVLDRDLIRNFN